jgi:LmbE family N-acetylglucosaminyl deacetylase
MILISEFSHCNIRRKNDCIFIKVRNNFFTKLDAEMSLTGTKSKSRTVAVIVAHPDDETLWVGGTILKHPSWCWYIISLCRASDADRAPKFHKVVNILGAKGDMGDLDDGPDQEPLQKEVVQECILKLLPGKHFDLIITHDPSGEYTRHLRHEETSQAVINLWYNKRLFTKELWTFAYEDGGKKYLPKPKKNAYFYYELPAKIWQKKYQIITDIYGFNNNSFEAQTTPRAEAFWQFTLPEKALQWLNTGGNKT